ncbi:MAG TPA: hypothetical protein VEC14_16760 [Reyranellaceae bacterium]|nr:hypothetical protein [Reyranellaceae bacterium]
MKLARLLVWLLAAVALAAPPAMSRDDVHAAMPHAESAKSDCHDSAPPPPDPCPDAGTGKHAAATCCPLMGGTVAVMPAATGATSRPEFHDRVVSASRHLVGLTYAKDPPPPRV